MIGDEGLKVLAKTIGKSKNIIHLDVSSNQITHKGAKKLFKALLPNTALVSLKLGAGESLQKNKIGAKAAPTLSLLL